MGSISHKEDCAVAVARFRIEDGALVGLLSRDEDLVQKSSEADRVSNVVNWKEECPIPTDEDFNQESLSSKINRNGDSTIGQQLSGIGIDLERIDGKRGRRIQRKVLTEREQKELGRLEVGDNWTMQREGIVFYLFLLLLSRTVFYSFLLMY